jgi:hypothetical protein
MHTAGSEDSHASANAYTAASRQHSGQKVSKEVADIRRTSTICIL